MGRVWLRNTHMSDLSEFSFQHLPQCLEQNPPRLGGWFLEGLVCLIPFILGIFANHLGHNRTLQRQALRTSSLEVMTAWRE